MLGEESTGSCWDGSQNEIDIDIDIDIKPARPTGKPKTKKKNENEKERMCRPEKAGSSLSFIRSEICSRGARF